MFKRIDSLNGMSAILMARRSSKTTNYVSYIVHWNGRMRIGSDWQRKTKNVDI
jgi:hypothetical protein